MSLVKVNAGEKIFAADHNSLVDGIIAAQHDLYNLFLQAYFDGKSPNSSGIIFDGLIDTTKTDTIKSNGKLVFKAASGQDKLKLEVGQGSQFGVGKTIAIYDGVNHEEKVIQAVNLNQSGGGAAAFTENFESYTLGAIGGQGNWTGAGTVVSSPALEGTKTLQISGGTGPESSALLTTIAGLTGSIQSYAWKVRYDSYPSSGGNGAVFHLKSGATDVINIRSVAISGTIQVRHNTSYRNTKVGGFIPTLTTTYLFIVEYNKTLGTYRLKTGSEQWSPWNSISAGGTSGNIDNLEIERDRVNGSVYFDIMQGYNSNADAIGIFDEIDLTTNLANTFGNDKAKDDFESYTSGASISGLNGGSGWAGAYNALATAPTIAVDQFYDGAQSVKIVTGSGNGFDRAIVKMAYGQLTIRFRKDNASNPESWITLYEGTTKRIRIQISNTPAVHQQYNNGASSDSLGAYTANVWHTITVSWNKTTGKFWAALNTADAPAERDVESPSDFKGIDKIEVKHIDGVAGNTWFDLIEIQPYSHEATLARTSAIISEQTGKTIRETFDTYIAGQDIAGKNGGFGWSGAWVDANAGAGIEIFSETAPSGGQGGLAAKTTSPMDLAGATSYYREFTGRTKGKVRFWHRQSISTVRSAYGLRFGGTNAFSIRFMTNGNIEALGTGTTTVQAYVVNTWYEIEAEFDASLGTNGQVKVSVIGGSSTAFLEAAVDFTTISRFNASYGAGGEPTGGEFWFDDVRVIESEQFQVGLKRALHHSINNRFNQEMAIAGIWVMRNRPSKYNLASSIAVSATTLTITGDKTAEFANGDTIDIADQFNNVRERKTLTATPTFGSGVTTLTFTPSVVNATGFATTATVERVDILPKMSIVDNNATESLASPTYQKTLEVTVDGEALVEDEYQYSPSPANNDVVLQLLLTRNTTAVVPKVKRYGIALNP